MRPPGPLEIGLIIVIIFIVFGAGKLPQVFDYVGKGFRSLRGGKKSGLNEGEEKVKANKKVKKKVAKD